MENTRTEIGALAAYVRGALARRGDLNAECTRRLDSADRCIEHGMDASAIVNVLSAVLTLGDFDPLRIVVADDAALLMATTTET